VIWKLINKRSVAFVVKLSPKRYSTNEVGAAFKMLKVGAAFKMLKVGAAFKMLKKR
jgi:hypothetical protein